jgi:hypothetical protein
LRPRYGDYRTARSIVRPGYPDRVRRVDYRSGDDYVVDFDAYRLSFSRCDFEERVVAAAVKLGLLERNELDDDETADLVELAADGQLSAPRSALGQYLLRHWDEVSLVGDESLVYWLRKLVFRSAWLDHRVKQGLLRVAWDDESAEFTYSDANGDRALLEIAPVPSWHDVQFRR